jgi:hypothetical protein
MKRSQILLLLCIVSFLILSCGIFSQFTKSDSVEVVPSDNVYPGEIPAEKNKFALPDELPVITKDNANQIVELFQYGKGEIRGISWAPTCKIRSMSSTDSGACRPLIPEHAVH